MGVIITTIPSPDFYNSCKSNVNIYSKSSEKFLDSISGSATINLGNYIATNSNGELSYSKNILSSPSFSIIMKLSFTNNLGGSNIFFDAYPKLRIRRLYSSAFGVTWKGTNGVQYFIQLPSSSDVNMDTIFDIAVTRNAISTNEIVTSFYFNGEFVGSVLSGEVDNSVNAYTGDYIKISTVANPANVKMYDFNIWNGIVLNKYTIKNYHNGISDYFYNWNSISDSTTWESAFSSKAISDTYVGELLMDVDEFYSVLPSYYVNWSSILKVLESIKINEILHKNVNIHTFNEFFDIKNSSYVNNFKKNVIIPLNISDSVKNNSIWSRNEYLNFNEKISKQYNLKYIYDTFSLDDANVFKGFTKTYKCNIDISDIINSNWNIINYLSDSIGLSEKYNVNYILKKDDFIALDERYIRNALAVISDIEFRNTELTSSDFLTITQSPSGYTPFKDFLSGDYTYEEALIKVILSADITADRPYVSEWKLNVDVPDIVDRGTVTLSDTNQPVYVSFSQKFHVPPEISGLLKYAESVSGSLPTPCIFNVTKSGFNIILKAGDTYSIGSVSWTAIGY